MVQVAAALAVDGGGDYVDAGRSTASTGTCRNTSHLRYACCMSEVASRELRNSTRSLLDRVEAGETITITVGGRPTAVLTPVGRRRRWAPRNEFVTALLTHQADPGLARDLQDLAGETTDELPLP